MNLAQPFISWLLGNSEVSGNKLFLNAVTAEENAIQVVSEQINKAEDIEYIDGSVLHKVIFTIFDHKSISFNQLMKTQLDKNENIDDLLNVGSICDWISEQDKLKNYPDFGANFEVQSLYPQYLTPSTPTIDNGLAKYSIPVVCEVLECQPSANN